MTKRIDRSNPPPLVIKLHEITPEQRRAIQAGHKPKLEPWREYFLRRVADQQARAIIRRSAIELYLVQGHTQVEAETLAAALLNSPAMFRLPDVDDL